MEHYEGDLDSHFESDGMNVLLSRLDYSTTDERIGARQRHSVPISGNVRNGTATLKSHTKLYWEFREYGSVGAERPAPGFSRMRPRRQRSPQSAAKHYANFGVGVEGVEGVAPIQRAAVQDHLKWLEDNLKEVATHTANHLSGLSDAATELVSLHQHLTVVAAHIQTLKRKLRVLEDTTAALRDQLDDAETL